MFTAFEKRLPKNEHTDKLLVKIREAAKEYKGKEITDLSFSKYKDFFETGNRVPYEDDYIDHRRRLAAFAMLCLNGEDYITELEDSIWAVCNEFTWALPAHVAGMKLHEVPFRIDLFSAETIFTLTELLSLTEDLINPMVVQRIRYEARRRIIEPYLKGEITLPKMKNNWDAVCGCGVGAAVLYLCSREEAEKVIPDFVAAMDSFLESYDEDGCCKEGALYWEYGFGYYCYFADLLYKYTDGRINLFANEKIHNIALYRQKIVLDKNNVIPFSDASHNFTFYTGLSDFLAGRFDDIVSVSLDYETEFDYDYRYRTAAILRSFYWYDENVKRGNAPDGVYSFADSMQYIFRNRNFVLAVKGGNNGEPHNHNDLGCFVLYTDEDGYVIDDPGWPDYDDKYFSDKRYDNICASSFGHSVPAIDGKEQLTGEKVQTAVNKFTDNFVELDLSAAYGVKAVRSFEVDSDSVSICDKFDTDMPVVQRLVTRIQPIVQENGRIKIGKAEIEVKGAEFTGVKSETFKPRLNICKCDMKETEILYIIEYRVNMPKNSSMIIIHP